MNDTTLTISTLGLMSVVQILLLVAYFHEVHSLVKTTRKFGTSLTRLEQQQKDDVKGIYSFFNAIIERFNIASEFDKSNSQSLFNLQSTLEKKLDSKLSQQRDVIDKLKTDINSLIDSVVEVDSKNDSLLERLSGISFELNTISNSLALIKSYYENLNSESSELLEQEEDPQMKEFLDTVSKLPDIETDIKSVLSRLSILANTLPDKEDVITRLDEILDFFSQVELEEIDSEPQIAEEYKYVDPYA